MDRFWVALDAVPDIFVNNAGIYVGKEFHDMDESYINRTMQINYHSVEQMCREYIKRRMKVGGTIINIRSIEAKSAFKKDMSIYAVSKAAVLTLTRSLSREYAKKKFKINAIVPGGIGTPGFMSLVKDTLLHFRISVIKTAAHFIQRLPVGRLGEPDDIAKVALFLATPMIDYMSGSEVVVDGGFLTS